MKWYDATKQVPEEDRSEVLIYFDAPILDTYCLGYYDHNACGWYDDEGGKLKQPQWFCLLEKPKGAK